MKVELIGTGSIGSKNISACALINEEILIDLPNGVIKRLKQTGHDVTKIKTVLITHMHGDHFFDVPFFMLERFFTKPENSVKLYCPVGGKEKIKQLIELGFPGDYEKINAPINLEIIEFEDLQNEIISNDIFVDSKIVDHHRTKPAHGFIIKEGNKSIGFSGDSNLCDAIEEIVQECDISVLDMSFAENKKPAHMGFDDIEYLCNKYKNKKIITTHMRDFTKEFAKGKNIDNLIIPDDGYCIIL